MLLILSMRFLKFFAANIRNPHTRRTYARAAEGSVGAACPGSEQEGPTSGA
jgi:hypothetical protein